MKALLQFIVPAAVLMLMVVRGQSALCPGGQLREYAATRIELSLDEPADQVRLELANSSQPVFLNDCSEVALSSPDGLHFACDLVFRSLYHPRFASGRPVLDSLILATPVVTRGESVSRLEPRVFCRRLLMPRLSVPLRAPGVFGCEGRFGHGLCFDGDDGMVAVNQMRFAPECGAIEFWVFPPLLHREESGVICFIQTSIGHGDWRYHVVDVPANSRRIRYLTYNGKAGHAVSVVQSPEITAERWIHVIACHDLSRGVMELFVDGRSQGTAEYKAPCGGACSDLNLGGRVHFHGSNYRFITNCQMLIDDLRVSDVVRPASVPSAPLVRDDHTLLLLDFDHGGWMRGEEKENGNGNGS